MKGMKIGHFKAIEDCFKTNEDCFKTNEDIIQDNLSYRHIYTMFLQSIIKNEDTFLPLDKSPINN